MKISYSGKILKYRQTPVKDYFILERHETRILNKKNLINKFKLNDEDFKCLRSNINKYNNNKYGITSSELIDILDKVNLHLSWYDSYNIIYEIVEDTDGNRYAKEIITGLIFPLGKFYDRKYFYSLENEVIKKESKYINYNLARFGAIVKEDGVASINEVNSYVNKQDDKTYSRSFKNNLQNYYNENVFNKGIILKENEQLERLDDTTILMEDIEYILNLLKIKNIELYNKYYNEYQKLYIGKNTNNIYIPKKRDFSNLLSKIKLSLLINDSKCNNIIEFLDIATQNYFNKLISNEKKGTNINLIDVENFTDMFLKSKDNYTITDQRDILKKISLLYIFVIKDNINNIDYSILENSYFKENIKTMILNINELNENNIIDSVSLDFSKIYSLEETFNIIKSINFKEKDIKKLIK